MGEQHTIVVGLGFGDEAKGATVAHYARTRNPAAVIRFNGGAQTAHNVVFKGRHHTFRQFGSGTFSEVPTYLSRNVVVDPWELAFESSKLEGVGVTNPLRLMSVSPEALVATPLHRLANRTREDLRGGAAHGSCGMGIGETRWYSLAHTAQLRSGDDLWGIAADSDVAVPPITVADCYGAGAERLLRERLSALREFYRPLLSRGEHSLRDDFLDDAVSTLASFGRAVRVTPDAEFLRENSAHGTLLFEGAQGILLDEWRGFHPHTTWSTTLPSGAQELLAEAGLPPAEVCGVLRTYATRHGHGPFPTEDPTLSAALPEPHNGTGRYQGAWRVGHVDAPLIRYAAEVCRRHGGLDHLSVSHLDSAERADGALRIARGYSSGEDSYLLGEYRDLEHQERLTEFCSGVVAELEPVSVRDIPAELELAAGAPTRVVSNGPDVVDRRTMRAEVLV